MPRERSIGSRLRGKVTSLLSPRGGGGENFEAVNNSSGVVIAFSGTNPSRKVKQVCRYLQSVICFCSERTILSYPLTLVVTCPYHSSTITSVHLKQWWGFHHLF